MKRITLLLATLLISTLGLLAEEVLLCDVETVKSDYTVGAGAVFEVVENPLKSGVNTTDSVIQIGRTGINWWENIIIPFTSFETVLGENYIDVAVKYPAQPDIAIRVNGNKDYQFRPESRYSNINGWEVIRFNIASIGGGISVNSLTFYVDAGYENVPDGFVLNNTDAFGYIDQIKYINAVVEIPETLNLNISDFEDAEQGWVPAHGAVPTLVANPDNSASSINGTANCLQLADSKTTAYALIDYDTSIFVPNSACYLHVMAKSKASPNFTLRTMPDNALDIQPIDSLVPNNEWQDLVFNIKTDKAAGYAISQLRLMLDAFEDNINDTDTLLYIDQIIISTSATPRTTTATALETARVEVAMYPNPVQDVLYFAGSDVDGVVLFNMAGKQVMAKSVANSHVNIGSLTEGIYYIQCKDAMGKVISNQSIIKK